MNGTTGATHPVQSQGRRRRTSSRPRSCSWACICARQYFTRDTPAEQAVRWRVTELWQGVEWNWYTQGGQDVLYWHWSPFNGWAINHAIRGWNECLITYVLAASAPRYAIDPQVYHHGLRRRATASSTASRTTTSSCRWACRMAARCSSRTIRSAASTRAGCKDRYADYWDLNTRHVRINHAHCVANPHKHKGYGAACWGLTASDDFGGYGAHAPDNDNGTISPTAALASLPYAPREVMQTLRHFLTHHGERSLGPLRVRRCVPRAARTGMPSTFLAIDQGPIVVDDGEPSHGPAVEAVHERAGSAGRPAPARLHEPASGRA